MAKGDEKNWREWTVFFVAALLTLGLISVLIRDAGRLSPEPVRCEVILESARREGSVHRIPVRVENLGGQTTENVHVEVALVRGTETLETATLELPLLPRGGMTEGMVAFSTDPAESDRIETRCASYRTP